MGISLKFLAFFLVLFVLSGCTFVQEVKSLKNNVLDSINYNNDPINNEQQIQKQYEEYKRNFKKDRITTFQDPLFDPEYGQTGLWLPSKFVSQVGGGMFFINQFDPNKPPLLLIHGAGGNPREWISIATQLEKRFQIIVVSYPSGMRLEVSAKIIKEGLEYLADKYSYQNISVIAHSMGGLVAKKMIDMLFLEGQISLQKFISISSPWGGDELASNSMKLNYTLPYWVDMKPNSNFLKDIYSFDFAKRVEYYLIFGYKGELSLTKGINNDGVVTLKSQLHPAMQDKAFKVIGYNETHTSILQSKKVIIKIENLLNSSPQSH